MAWASARCKPQALRIAAHRVASHRKPQKGANRPPQPNTEPLVLWWVDPPSALHVTPLRDAPPRAAPPTTGPRHWGHPHHLLQVHEPSR